MAGFDLDTQRSFTLPGGGRGEAGYFDISAWSRAVEVPTRLVSCYYGKAVAESDTINQNYHLVATTDCSISSGAITFRRHGMYWQEDTRFYYVVYGW